MDFIECNICASKSGSPILCPACIHNRTMISNLKQTICLLEQTAEAHELIIKGYQKLTEINNERRDEDC